MALPQPQNSVNRLLSYCSLLTKSIFLYSITLQLFSALITASPVPSPESPSQWFQDQFFPKQGVGPTGELQCYGLPYGGLGFVSHLLTFYTAAVVGMGRAPFTWQELEYSVWDIIITIISMIFTVVLAGFTISSCRNSWPFALLAVWKLVLGLVQPICEITAISTGNKDGLGTFAGFFFYGFAGIVGGVGIFKITHDTFAYNADVRIITYVLLGLVGIIMIISIFMACKEGSGSIVVLGLGISVLLFMLYADWILAAIVANWAGVPDEEHKALYWTYWVAKRLPMLSF
jgi:hypothetical protein